MVEKLPALKEQLSRVDAKLSEPGIMGDMAAYKALMLERSHLAPVVEELEKLASLLQELEVTEQMLKIQTDAEMLQMCKEEIEGLKIQIEETQKKCKMLLIPPDPLDGKNIIMEIRAGTGGDEAALFASDLYNMYSRYCDAKGFKREIMTVNETLLGGIKEIILSISGKEVYGTLRFESGVHRVQRVPETESGGRIHTSACTVAVLPEMEETDIQIRQEDLKIDVMRAGGPGGQCVNTTDSAVRITHLPTGLVVIQQDEKSQIRNREKAMRVLRARLFDLENSKKLAERAQERKSMVGTGDRSERIRTYNFPQNRLTDHRINLTLYKLDQVVAGNLDEVIEPLKIAAGEAALKEAK